MSLFPKIFALLLLSPLPALTAAVSFEGGIQAHLGRLTAERLPGMAVLIGRYQYGPGIVLTVTRDGASVFAQLTGQPPFPIFPKSAIEFEWRVVEPAVTFNKDENGKVTGATHRQNGTTLEAPKVE